ncbi:MAG TPA: signal peptidase II [Candidatus Omnitrophica bacterium]|nr:signal peptidase II [Candidatus Omnitrophota bacterium]
MNFRPAKLGLLFTSFFLLDRIVKSYLISYPLGSELMVVIPGVFSIKTVFNTGVAFGLLRGYPQLLTVINVILVLFIVVYTFKTENPRMKLWLTFILTGAVSNIVDRFIYGGILDYFDLSFWPTFNLADTYITIGIIGIIFNAGIKRTERI